MTKAELFNRFRWPPLVLPIATAAVFRLLIYLNEHNLFGSLPSAAAQACQWLAGVRVELFLAGWLILTLICSVRTARAAVDGTHLRGARRLMVVLLTTPLIFAVHAAACMALLQIFPLH